MRKKLLSFCILFIVANTILAQAPQSFKYQAIARDTEGNILSNQNINLRISIVNGNTTSVAVYSETHNLRTSPFGLINLEIGNGENKSGDFSAIDWSKGNYFVNIEIDENGGTDYVSMGSSQLLSVPYALYSEESGTSTSLSTGAKEADSWTEGIGVTYLTNPNNVGIGTTAPVSKLHVTGTGINAVYERNISTAAGPANRFYKSRGTASSKTQVQAGDNMGQFQFWGMGDDGAYDIGATLKGVAESTRTGTDIFDVAASIQFLTTNTSFSWGERMRITADGNVGIGTTAPAGILDIAGQYHFPSVDGIYGQVLRTDGIGTLYWSQAGASEINDLLDARNPGGSIFLGTGSGINDDGTLNYNVGIGEYSLYSNTSGSSNTATGTQALFYNTTANFNTAVGSQALYSNSNGENNTAVGGSSLISNTSGDYNTALGAFSMNTNVLGSENTALGYRSLYYNNSGIENTAIGNQASERNTTGSYNTNVGYRANLFNQAGSNNTIIGFQAGQGVSNHSKSGNVFIGHQSGYYETGDNKLYIDNSNTASPLLYGDFSSNLLRINGTLDINNAYQLPTADGTSGQVLQTNGTGTLSWATASGVTDINGLSDGKTGGNSVFLGADAGAVDDGTSNQNVGVGIEALKANTSGEHNTATGYNALIANTTGDENAAYGSYAMYSNTTGERNTAFGTGALYNNTGGQYNVGIGEFANYNNQGGSYNTMIGYEAGMGTSLNNKSGNVCIGYQAGMNDNSNNKLYIDNSSTALPLIYGDFSTNILTIYGMLDINNLYHFPTIDGSNGQIMKTNGSGALTWYTPVEGATNINGLSDGKTGGNSVFLGDQAGYDDNGTSNCNTGVGYYALYENTSGAYNTAVGYQALQNNYTASGNTAIGRGALYTNTTGFNNTALGNRALESNTIATSNTAVGSFAMFDNTTGGSNSAFGDNALSDNTTGGYNTAIGASALGSNVNGNNNTGIGFRALRYNTGGSGNTAVGLDAKYANSTGSYNTVMGYDADYYNLTGSSNTIIGYEAGKGSSAHSKEGNVFIGYQAGYYETGNGKLYIDNSSTSAPLVYGDFGSNILRVNGTFNINGFYNLPTSDGFSGQVIQTNGSGTLSWTSAAPSNIDALTDGISGGNSVFLGSGSGPFDDQTDNRNTGVGVYSLYSNTSGSYNTAVGYDALNSNTYGGYNTVVGHDAADRNSSGNNNSIYGCWADYYNNSGSNNTIIGYEAGNGPYSHSKSGSVFIGYQAGYSETLSNKLYIENSNDAYPLIYGDFSSDYVTMKNNLGIGYWARSFGGGTNTLAFYYTTNEPYTSPANTVLLYSVWESSYAELRVRDELGNVTTLSPHNFKMLEKSEPMAWAFYSKNANLGKEINVDMLRAIRVLENISGEKLAYIKDIDTDSKELKTNDVQQGIIQKLEKKIEELEARVAELER